MRTVVLVSDGALSHCRRVRVAPRRGSAVAAWPDRRRSLPIGDDEIWRLRDLGGGELTLGLALLTRALAVSFR